MKESTLKYVNSKKDKKENVAEGIISFIETNDVEGTEIEIEKIVKSSVKMTDGVITGEGDRFSEWCRKNGRPIPSSDVVKLMNRDPQAGREAIKNDPNRGRMMFSLCSFLAGKGRKSVRAL